MTRFVSVVIPTYNHACFLEHALQSVRNQTYPHWEALVVDNHSQDNTDDVVKSLCDPRIRLFKIHNNGVIAASRNLGIRKARGEWLAFLDSDDFWYSKKLETIMAVLETDDNYDVLSTDELKIDINKGTKQVLRYGPYQHDFYKELLIGGNRLSPSAAVIRREFLLRHSLVFGECRDYVTVEDYSLWLDLARMGARFNFIHKVQGEYRIHGNNNSKRTAVHWKNGEILLRHHVFNVQHFDPCPKRLWKQISCRLHVGRARQLLVKGQIGLAFKEAFRAVINSPGATVIYLLSKLKRPREN